MRIVIITLSLFSLLLAGCASLEPITTKPPESAIELKAPVKFPGFFYTVTFPAGVYHPLYEDKDGYYYQAPAKVIGHDLFNYMLDGGLYVERTTNEPSQWYIINPQNGEKTMGKCGTLPEHTLIP